MTYTRAAVQDGWQWWLYGDDGQLLGGGVETSTEQCLNEAISLGWLEDPNPLSDKIRA